MTKEEKYIEDELQLKYIKDWKDKKSFKRHRRCYHYSMIKMNLECAFNHFIELLKCSWSCR